VTDENRCRFDQACRVKAIKTAAQLGPPSRLSINFMPNAIYRPELCIRATLAAASAAAAALAAGKGRRCCARPARTATRRGRCSSTHADRTRRRVMLQAWADRAQALRCAAASDVARAREVQVRENGVGHSNQP
jgi:hypothetical protein